MRPADPPGAQHPAGPPAIPIILNRLRDRLESGTEPPGRFTLLLDPGACPARINIDAPSPPLGELAFEEHLRVGSACPMSWSMKPSVRCSRADRTKRSGADPGAIKSFDFPVSTPERNPRLSTSRDANSAGPPAPGSGA